MIESCDLMDPLLIIITVTIVMGIAYILSRPFANPVKATEMPVESENYHQQYKRLLREIKVLQDECDHFDAPEEICNQIEEKKRLAADLLKLINAPVEVETSQYPVKEAVDPEETQPETHILRESAYVCPQCGNRVASSDKFCTHCGNRLQP